MPHLNSQERLVLLAVGFIFLAGSVLHWSFQKQPRLYRWMDAGNSTRFALKVDLNRASFEELVKVPYIGEKTARRILEYREKHGRFRNLEELMELEGMYKANFEKMKSYLKIKEQLMEKGDQKIGGSGDQGIRMSTILYF